MKVYHMLIPTKDTIPLDLNPEGVGSGRGGVDIIKYLPWVSVRDYNGRYSHIHLPNSQVPLEEQFEGHVTVTYQVPAEKTHGYDTLSWRVDYQTQNAKNFTRCPMECLVNTYIQRWCRAASHSSSKPSWAELSWAAACSPWWSHFV